MYRRILIINPFGIGDVLFTTPIIHALTDAFPGVKIGYLCNRRTACLLKNNPHINSVYIYERDEFVRMRRKSIFTWLKSVLEFIYQIKKERFDLALDFSLNTQYGFFSWLTGIKERVGYDFKGRGGFLTRKLTLTGYSDRHIVEYYAELLKYLNVDLTHRNLELYLKGEDILRVDGILAREDLSDSDFLVGIVPGSGRSWGKDAYLKHWPADKFAQLADKIIENYQAKIIILGDNFEKEIAKAITSKMVQKVYDFSGMLTLGELAALLSRMKLVIANDGGPLHMAVALGLKTISIFGPVSETVYGPYPTGNGHIVIKKDVACRPCYQNFRMPVCSRNRECIESISIDQVLQAIRRLW